MSSRIIKTNYDNPNLYCDYSKKKILLGEKYCLQFDRGFGAEFVDRHYKLEFMNDINGEGND